MLTCIQVLDHAIETEKMIEKYESMASDLLEWIEQTIIILNNRKFANSLVGVQQQLQAFNTYRTVEKPPKSVHARCKTNFILHSVEMNKNSMMC